MRCAPKSLEVAWYTDSIKRTSNVTRENRRACTRSASSSRVDSTMAGEENIHVYERAY